LYSYDVLLASSLTISKSAQNCRTVWHKHIALNAKERRSKIVEQSCIIDCNGGKHPNSAMRQNAVPAELSTLSSVPVSEGAMESANIACFHDRKIISPAFAS
jgi:hypothetical protein